MALHADVEVAQRVAGGRRDRLGLGAGVGRHRQQRLVLGRRERVAEVGVGREVRDRRRRARRSGARRSAVRRCGAHRCAARRSAARRGGVRRSAARTSAGGVGRRRDVGGRGRVARDLRLRPGRPCGRRGGELAQVGAAAELVEGRADVAVQRDVVVGGEVRQRRRSTCWPGTTGNLYQRASPGSARLPVDAGARGQVLGADPLPVVGADRGVDVGLGAQREGAAEEVVGVEVASR